MIYVYVKKTLGFTDIRVINKLEEIKLMGGNLSQYVAQLILQDIERENGKYTIEELINFIQNTQIRDNNYEVKNTKTSNSISDLMMSVIDE